MQRFTNRIMCDIPSAVQGWGVVRDSEPQFSGRIRLLAGKETLKGILANLGNDDTRIENPFWVQSLFHLLEFPYQVSRPGP